MTFATDCMTKYLEEQVAPRGLLGRLRQLLELWRCRMRVRAELAGLDARSIQDIGVTVASIEAELRKPFWRPIALRPERDVQ
jgi:uncharacterized protein YjiS (DUF1127 family)